MTPISQSMRPPLRLRTDVAEMWLAAALRNHADALADVAANSDPRQTAYLAANAELLRCRVSRLRIELRASRITA